MDRSKDYIITLMGDANDQTNANHHVIPKFYLEGFTENGKVSVWGREDGRFYTAFPSNIAKEKGFYTLTLQNGDKNDELEKIFSDIEGRTKTIIQNINSLFPPAMDGDLKVTLASYIALQYVRTPEYRRRAELTGDQFAKLDILTRYKTKKQVVEALKRQGKEPTDERVKSILEFSDNPHAYEIVPDKNSMIKIAIEMLPEIIPTFLNRPWRIVTFSKPSLITSDTPVLLIPDYETPGIGATGLATAKEIWFPLSSTRMLVMGRMGMTLKNGVSDGNDHYAKEANEAQIRSSYIEAYGPPSLLKPFENTGLGNRALMQISSGFDEEFFDHYNKPPDRLRPHR